MTRELLPENSQWPQKLLLASPRGFCAGVVRAVNGLWEFHKANQRERPGSTTYSYHQIIHNTHVVRQFEQAGVVFVNDITNVPKDSNLMFSAHGVSPKVVKQAEERRLRFLDTTCPLVDKPHREVRRFAKEGFDIFYIGHAGHDEAVGILGEAPERIRLIETADDARLVEVSDPNKVALVTQTTLSFDDSKEIKDILKMRFPNIIEPPKSDICYATQNRQDGVTSMVKKGAEIVVVVGSQNSSNSKRLTEVAMTNGPVRSYLIDDVSELKPDWFIGAKAVGLTSGASVPEDKFQEVVAWFEKLGSNTIEEVKVADESRINFSPPK